MSLLSWICSNFSITFSDAFPTSRQCHDKRKTHQVAIAINIEKNKMIRNSYIKEFRASVIGVYIFMYGAKLIMLEPSREGA